MIFGMLGYIGSGKGTTGDILESVYDFKKESFANPVKDAIAAIFGWDRNLLEGDTNESRLWRDSLDPWWNKRVEGMTPRYALQLMGTEAGRNIFDSDIWLYSLERRMYPGNNYVITDVRFPNEIHFIHNLGGKIIRVKRGPEPLWYDDALKQNTSRENSQHLKRFPGIHYSEWAWIGQWVDYIIDNEGSLSDLELKIKEIVDNNVVK